MDENLVLGNCDNFVHMINFFFLRKTMCGKNWIRECLYIIVM
jgi:hypothetical protein